MDPIKKFRIFFWVIFSLLIIVIAAGSYYFFNLDSWKEGVVFDKDQKIAQLEQENRKKDADLSQYQTSSDQSQTSLASTNTQLKVDNDKLTTENTDLKADKTLASAYNNFFKYLTSVIETHGGFTGWTDAEFQTGRSLAEKTGNTAFVSTINWAWYETSVDPSTRVIRVWNETAAGIENALK